MKKIIVNNHKVIQVILKGILIIFVTAMLLAARDAIKVDLAALEPGFITSFYTTVLIIFLIIVVIITTVGVWKAINRISRCSLKEALNYEELPF